MQRSGQKILPAIRSTGEVAGAAKYLMASFESAGNLSEFTFQYSGGSQSSTQASEPSKHTTCPPRVKHVSLW